MDLGSTNWEERLSRLETIVSRAEYANTLAHEHFRSEDTMILTSQIALNSAQEKTNRAVDKLADVVQAFIVETRAADRKLRRRMNETTEKLNALIRIVDGMIPRSEGLQ